MQIIFLLQFDNGNYTVMEMEKMYKLFCNNVGKIGLFGKIFFLFS